MVSPTPECPALSWAALILSTCELLDPQFGPPSPTHHKNQDVRHRNSRLVFSLHADACVPPKLSLDTSIRMLQSLRIRRDVHIVQKCHQPLSLGQPVIDCAHTRMLSKSKQEGHQRVSLLAPFALFDMVHGSIIALPQICGRLAVELSDERHDVRTSLYPHQRFQHGLPGHEVERTNAVDGQDGCARIVLCGRGFNDVTHLLSDCSATNLRRISPTTMPLTPPLGFWRSVILPNLITSTITGGVSVRDNCSSNLNRRSACTFVSRTVCRHPRWSRCSPSSRTPEVAEKLFLLQSER